MEHDRSGVPQVSVVLNRDVVDTVTNVSTTCAVVVFRVKMLTLKLSKARAGVRGLSTILPPPPTNTLFQQNCRWKNAMITVIDTAEVCFQYLLSDLLRSIISLNSLLTKVNFSPLNLLTKVNFSPLNLSTKYEKPLLAG